MSKCFPPLILVYVDAVPVTAPKQPLIAVTLMLVAVWRMRGGSRCWLKASVFRDKISWMPMPLADDGLVLSHFSIEPAGNRGQ